MKTLYCFIAVFCAVMFCFQYPCSSQVMINEIMFNPPGNENHNEYIEIINTGEGSIDLTGWVLSDSTSADKIIETGAGIILKPGQYGLILDPDYFSNSSLYDTLINTGCLILTIDGSTFGSRGFSNSRAELVMLMSGSGDLISSHRYSTGNQDGFSDEKKIPYGVDNDADWADSENYLSSPGFRNSITPLDYDVTVDSIMIDPCYPVAGRSSEIQVTVINTGFEPVQKASLIIFADIDRNGAEDPGEMISETELDTVSLSEFGDSLVYICRWLPELPGETVITTRITCSSDQNPDNNIKSIRVFVLEAENNIIINEIMYDPPAGNMEWIEIYNNGSNVINLRYYTIGDISDPIGSVISDSACIIQPGRFLILTGDAISVSVFHSITVDLIEVSGFPSLNNTGDEIFIRDPSGRISDSVNYRKEWGNNKGVSLERISNDSESNDSNNWGLSSDPTGSTPGKPNSLLFNEYNTAPIIFIENSPFSPDRGETAEIKISLPFQRSNITIRIFDRYGRPVRDLIGGEDRGSSFMVTWDGRNNNGNLMGTGVYIVFFNAVNTVSDGKITRKVTIVLVR
ncbi:MAG: hypothetical protein GY863_21880 [bacterium]|nr:hypothetical protein [bacterium]